MGNSAKRDLRDKEHQELIDKVCQLRARFLSHAAVAKVLGISRPYAAKLWKEGYEQVKDHATESALEARAVELERIELLLQRNWEQAASGGNPNALSVVLRGIEMICRIKGLYQAQAIKAELTSPGGGALQIVVSTEAARAFAPPANESDDTCSLPQVPEEDPNSDP